MDWATALLTGFGLAGAAGLNAYLPLLIVALAGRFTDWIRLSPPFDALTSWWTRFRQWTRQMTSSRRW